MTEKVPVSCNIRPQEISGGFHGKPKKAEEGFQQHDGGNAECDGDNHMRHDIGQDVAHDDAAVVGANGLRGAHIFNARQRQCFAAYFDRQAAPSRGPP